MNALNAAIRDSFYVRYRAVATTMGMQKSCVPQSEDEGKVEHGGARSR